MVGKQGYIGHMPVVDRPGDMVGSMDCKCLAEELEKQDRAWRRKMLDMGVLDVDLQDKPFQNMFYCRVLY